MKKFVNVFWALLLSIFLLSCQTTGSKMEVAELEKGIADYGRFLEEGDVESWLDLHADDAIKMPPGAPEKGMMQTEKEIRGELQFLEFVSFECMNEETVVSGNYGWNRGNYTVQVRLKEDGTLLPPTDGKYLTLFRKEPGGRWKIIRDCYNSNTTPQSTSQEEFNQIVLEIFDEYGRANIEGDVEAYLAIHDSDVRKMAPNSRPIVGIEALRVKKEKGYAKAKTLLFYVENEESVVFGNYGWAMGTYYSQKQSTDGTNTPNLVAESVLSFSLSLYFTTE